MENNIFLKVSRSSHLLRLIVILPVGIFLAEVLAMILILLFKGSYEFVVLLDATIATILVLPLIYLVSYRPLMKHIAERERAESIMQIRLRLMQFAVSSTVDELLQTTLDEIEVLTDSKIGFFHFLEADQKTLWLQAWSTNTLQNMCKAEGKGSHYSVDQAGVWADSVRQRQPVIHNDYASLLHRKGTPEGHAPIIREISVPILRDEKVLAILGVGNKPRDYTENDVELISTLADFAWDIIERKRVEEKVTVERARLRSILNTIPDGVYIVNQQFEVEYANPVIERDFGLVDGKKCYAYFYDRNSPCDWCKNEAVFSGERSSSEWNSAKTGKTYEVFDTPLTNLDGSVSKLKLIHDITARKHVAAELEKRNLELQALSASERKQRQEAETLRAVTQALTRTLNLDTVLKTLLNHVSALVETDIVSIGFTEDKAPMVFRSGQKSDGDIVPLFPVDVKTDPFFKKVAISCKSLLIHDATQDSDWINIPGVEPVRSWLGVPILVSDKVIGVVLLGKTQPGYFTQEHAQSAEALVSQASVAIQNAWLFEQVRAGRERLQLLSRRLVEIQEAERSYIARELHDQAGQSLTSLIIGLGQLEKGSNSPTDVQTRGRQLKLLANNILEDLHRLAVDLRPASLDHLGLVSALGQLITSFTGNGQLKVKFKSVGLSDADRLSAEIEATLYRIVQEALTNVVRHAEASRADVILERRDEAILLIIEDNGIGFNATKSLDNNHIGLIGIRERTEMLGGNITIESIIGNGTTLVVEVPNANTHSTG